MGSQPRLSHLWAVGAGLMSEVHPGMADPIIGFKVQITIEEDGNATPTVFPPGTIVRRLKGTDHNEYFLVRLDHPVTAIRAKTKEQWVLSEVALLPHFGGVRMERLLSQPEAGFDFVHVRIIRPLYDIQNDDALDLSNSAYFALGIARRI